MAGKTMKRKLLPPTMAKRIINLIDTLEPSEAAKGMTWYAEGNAFCKHLARNYRVPVELVCAVTAALSPRERWSTNKKLAEAAVRQYAQGFRVIQVGTLGTNCQRASKCMQSKHDTASLLEALGNGVKVRAFFLALNGDESHVVVDTWAVRAVTHGQSDRPGKYQRDIEQAYRIAAVQLGVTPSQCQAMAWVAIRGKAD